MHKKPTNYNNQNLPEDAVMGDFDTRYMSLVVQTQYPITQNNTVNANEALLQPDGSWVIVVLPQDPQLPDDQLAQVRAKAAELNYNVVGGGRLQENLGWEPGVLNVRMQRARAGFEGAFTNVPSWVDPDDPDTADNEIWTWGEQDSPEFFEKFSSGPANMGPYWIDGINETFEEFMAR